MAASAGDYACAREQAFPPSDDNAYRHLRVADFSDAVAALPPEELQVTHFGLSVELVARGNVVL